VKIVNKKRKEGSEGDSECSFYSLKNIFLLSPKWKMFEITLPRKEVMGENLSFFFPVISMRLYYYSMVTLI